MMRFKLRQMEVFRAVMTTGSMSGAARLLNITQPAISRVVAHTESSLGLRLFERRAARLDPTAEALRLLPEVERLYTEACRVDALALDLARNPGGTLTIGASPSLALHVIPRVIARYLGAHPQVQLRYHTTLLAAWRRNLYRAGPHWRSRCCRSTTRRCSASRWPMVRWSAWFRLVTP